MIKMPQENNNQIKTPKGYWNTLIKSITAGALIGIGATVYLSCANKVVGAFLFAIGLVSICTFGQSLFTGQIGYVFENKNYLSVLLVWFGNLIGTVACVLPIRYAKPDFVASASEMLAKKAALNIPTLLICGFFCGMIMFIAVESYKKSGTYLGILMGVPVFILCGFEHSIANMCYFAFAVSSLQNLLDAAKILFFVSVANSLGAIVMWWLIRKDHTPRAKSL